MDLVPFCKKKGKTDADPAQKESKGFTDRISSRVACETQQSYLILSLHGCTQLYSLGLDR
eukprot:scaffold37967_cov57-Phaeocystis_antarctica.AAC.2